MESKSNPPGNSVAPSPVASADFPFVSVVIPTRNEEVFMASCIKSLRELDYPADRLEVIFADGRSTDRTVAIAKEMGCRVLDNEALKCSAGRNIGYAASRGDIIAFTDADCTFEPQWIKNAVRHFREHPEFAGISGPTRVPQNQDHFGRAVGIVYELAGMAGSTVHLDGIAKLNEADDLPGCNAIYRRSALETVMPMITELYSAEDVALNASLKRRGFRLALAPDVTLWHFKRSSPKRFWKQMYSYAIGRLQVGKRDRSLMKSTHWAMGFGVPFTVLLAIVLGCIKPWIFAAVAAGILLMAAGMFLVYSVKKSPKTAAWVVVAMGILFCAWPLGFLREWFWPVPSSYDPWQKGRVAAAQASQTQ
jgi:cellulose synthase/poly-beta-1,6-N-acetylglucosamine synthase-like glycosyltransferase